MMALNAVNIGSNNQLHNQFYTNPVLRQVYDSLKGRHIGCHLKINLK
jgi:hypothetical protein